MLHADADRCQWSDQLISLLERQQTLVRRLLDLAEGQAALINRGSTDELLSLLGQRQRLVDTFVATQDDLTRLTTDLDQRLASAPPGARGRIRQLLGAVGDALAEIVARDSIDQQSLRTTRDAARDELSRVGVARVAHSAYRPAAVPAALSRFADQHG
jgi:hypothetical protein